MSKNSHVAIVSIGSNHEPASRIALCQSLMQREFAEVVFTRGLQTKAVGMTDANPFTNVITSFTTPLTVEGLQRRLKEIEQICGRVHDQADTIDLDLDLLSFDGIRYHEPDWQRPYIQQLLQSLSDEKARQQEQHP